MTSRRRTAVSAVAGIGLLVGALAAPTGPALAAGPFSLSAPALDFADQDVHGSARLSLTLMNDDGQPHSVEPASIAPVPSPFAIAEDGCSSTTVVPMAECTIVVRFDAVAGPQSGTLSIPVDGGATIYTIALSGVGVSALDVTAGLDFGTVRLDAVTGSQTATVANLGGHGTLEATSVEITGPHAADFSVMTDDCAGVPLDAAASCEVEVAFDPTAVGQRAAVLVIAGPSPMGTLLIPLSATVTGPASPVSWSTVAAAGPNNTWNYGLSLARTVDGSTQRLHLVYSTDRVGGKWVKAVGPYMGVYYVRSTSGETWTTPVRLNPSTQHAERSAVAATGARVYAVWVAQPKVTLSKIDSRVLYVRVNKDHGASDAWNSSIRLSAKSGQIDYPVVAASGANAYVAWTVATNGAIRLAVSNDRGGRWSTRTIGTTTALDPRGLGASGLPVVSASGSNVAVAWVADPSGAVKVRTSSDHGATWSPTTTLADASLSSVSVAFRGSRAAAAWTVDQGVVVSVKVGGAAWSTPVLAATGQGVAYEPAVALQDPARVGVAFTDAGSSDSAIRWVESPDNGYAWYQPQAAGPPSATRVDNSYPSVVWAVAGTRVIAWNGENAVDTYRQYVRTGSGTPAGLPTAAPRLTSLDVSVTPALMRHRER